MRTLIALLLLAATAGTASAYCVSVPDDQSSAYVKNGLKKTICLNNEIAQTTAVQNWQVEVNAAIGKLDRDFVSSKLDAIKPVEIPDYASPKPAWP
jgi:hypothetical protein